MSVQQCIRAYISLSEKVFQKQHRHPVTIRGKIQGRFDSKALEQAAKDLLREQHLEDNALLKDPVEGNCKV
jgi:hypothetical protein